MSIKFPLLSFALAAALAACAPTAERSDLPMQDVSGIGKADHRSIPVRELRVDIHPELAARGGTAVVTSADSFEEFFGVAAPESVDFDSEWVAFYGLGTRNTGGYSATIKGVSNLPLWGGMLLETHDGAAGAGCFTTQAITWPYTLVAFAAPTPTPAWFAVDSESEVYTCGPTNEDRLAELEESLDAWQQAREQASNSYTYTSEFQSFSGFGGRTTIVVEDGAVVERHYKAQHISGGEATQWSELGDQVGQHDAGADALVIDALYAQCASDILSADEETHWVNLVVDGSDGLLRSCTAAHKLCQDDCSRGPNIASITF